MTLVVVASGPESIWLLADRRLTYRGRQPKDDARKVMFLDTPDGVAILGYSGLGETALGTEPSDWMSSVLRGRNLPLEQSLGVLAEASRKEIPRHLVLMQGGSGISHNVFVPAFVEGETRLYSIDLVITSGRRGYQFRYTRHVTRRSLPTKPKTPALAIAGSGAGYLFGRKKWMRELLRLLRAYDRRRVSSHAVADYLASLNNEVSANVRTVGPRCIVAWRNKRKGVHAGGGGHQFYTGATRDASSPLLPTIGNGMDIRALMQTMMPRYKKAFEALRLGDPPRELNKDQINADLARLPDKPDEKLR
jgi:hypothetical protein